MVGLFLFLSLVIGGSFACMHGLVQAIAEKKIFDTIKMLIIEFFVMFVEVMFFYREFVDSLAPWLAQMSGDSIQLGLGSVIGIALMAWLGIRSGVWFFFAKYGTPTLLMIISREGIEESKAGEDLSAQMKPLAWIKKLTKEVQQDISWFTEKGEDLMSAFVLPPVQVLAVMTNFCMIVLTGKNLFNLPIKTLEELKDTREMIKEISAAVKEK